MELVSAAQPPSSAGTSGADIASLLDRHFGYRSFRPLQREVIEHVLVGGDAVVLMPTGGGKSLCYQVPALALDGLTLVVSPLIAWMKDQVQALQANGIAAAFLNSTSGFAEEQALEAQLRSGLVKLLYVSPERLMADGLLDRLGALNVRLFAIDGAQWISRWGDAFGAQDERVDVLRERVPHLALVALTAPAGRAVRSDIGG